MKIIQQFFPDLSSLQIQQFIALKKLYENWNEKINVISRKDMENFYTHHILHSLSIARVFQFQTNQTVMDLGTGGGFPGLPLAIFFPEIKFHLVDSINKKLKVAENIASQINLPNVNVQHTRAENIKDKKFDIVISRAVAPLKDLWEWSKPLLSGSADVEMVTGLICLKGGELEKEISESGTRPAIYEIEKIFPLPYFTEKYILHVT
ncbi:16S rRNA (guanine(527)-N(7))-methyltransferase RsmG [soil metagenome]